MCAKLWQLTTRYAVDEINWTNLFGLNHDVAKSRDPSLDRSTFLPEQQLVLMMACQTVPKQGPIIYRYMRLSSTETSATKGTYITRIPNSSPAPSFFAGKGGAVLTGASAVDERSAAWWPEARMFGHTCSGHWALDSR